jgi:hypothetical protein
MGARHLGLALLLAALLATSTRATTFTLDAATIKAALHTDSREAGDFIEQVIARVGQGDLPARMVEATFLWARKKPKYQFQFFKHAIQAEAKRRGITL